MCERLDSVLPFGWSLKTLSDIAIDENGIVDGPFGSNLKVSDYVDDAENGVPVLTTKNLSGDYSRGTLRYVTKDKYDTLKRSTVFPGDILVAKIGSIGKCGIYPLTQKKALIPANLLKITLKEEYDRKFVFYYIQSGQFQKLIKSISTATAQPAFNVTKFRKLPVIIPPLEEQKRIVARIEELFSELDAAVATLERTKEQLAVYRQAVLKEAFSGTISKHWREENVPSLEKMLERIANLKIAHKKKSIYTQTELIDLPLLPPEWKWISIGDISNGVEYGTSKKSEKEGLTAVIRMGNIQNGKIIWDDLVYSNDEEDIVKYQLKKGDVLFNRTNSPELVGKTAIYGGEQPAIFAGYLIRINHVECINSQYLTYYLNGFTAKQYGNKVKTDGVNQSNINGKKLCSYPFPLCTIEEQEYIVSEIESRLSVCDKIEETVTTALQEAEAMRQSILKQAFAGEL